MNHLVCLSLRPYTGEFFLYARGGADGHKGLGRVQVNICSAGVAVAAHAARTAMVFVQWRHRNEVDLVGESPSSRMNTLYDPVDVVLDNEDPFLDN